MARLPLAARSAAMYGNIDELILHLTANNINQDFGNY